MINGIQNNLESMHMAGTKNHKASDVDKAAKEHEKVVTSEDENKDERVNTAEAMEKIVHTAKFFNKEIHLEVEEDLNMVIVKVIDGETDEVIRQIPLEEIVELSRNAKNLRGLLIDREE